MMPVILAIDDFLGGMRRVVCTISVCTRVYHHLSPTQTRHEASRSGSSKTKGSKHLRRKPNDRLFPPNGRRTRRKKEIRMKK